MGTAISLNGVTYTIPAVGEDNWGTDVGGYLVALATGVLTKAGGAFTLTAEADFGGTYGLKSSYFKSRGTVAAAGVLRLANTESVSWRNAAGSADVALAVNASNWLQFGGVDLVDRTTSQTLTNKTIVAASNTITTASSGSLAATELNAALAELQTDIDTRAVGSTLSTHTAASSGVHGVVGSVVGTSDSQTLTNKTINGASNTLTVRLANDVSGALPIANGGTGQTSKTEGFDALAPTTTKGDLIVSNGSDNIRLAVGADGTVLSASSAAASGLAWTAPLTNPMDSAGDMIVGGASGAATKLDSGTSGQHLQSAGAASPAWTDTFTRSKTISLDQNGTTLLTISNADTGASSYTQLRLSNAAGDASYAAIFRNGSSTSGYGGAGSLNMGTVGAHGATIYTTNTVRLEVTSGGIVHMPAQISASAHRNASNQTGVNPNGNVAQLTMNSVAASSRHGFNIGSGFSTGTGSFVVPTGAAGKYLVTANVLILATNVLNNLYELQVRLGASFGTSAVVLGQGLVATSGFAIYLDVSGVLDLSAGETLWLALFGSGDNSASTLTMSGAANYSNWSIQKVA